MLVFSNYESSSGRRFFCPPPNPHSFPAMVNYGETVMSDACLAEYRLSVSIIILNTHSRAHLQSGPRSSPHLMRE